MNIVCHQESFLSRMMRAAVYRGQNTVCQEMVEIPEIGPRDVLVQVGVCGVCGTDLKKIHLGLVPGPRIFGHETAGTIVATGAEVSRWKVGDRVAVNHHIPCQSPDCYFCGRRAFAQCPVYKRTGATAGFEPAGGGFAEYVRVLEWCVDGMVKLPDDVTLEEASFIEPLNTCLKGIEMATVLPGDTVLVIGQGPIGLLFTQLAKLAGANVVATDRLDYRLDLSRRLGAECAINTATDDPREAILSLSEGRGADLAIVAVPYTDVIAQAFTLVRPAGKVLLFAQTRLNDHFTVDAGAICMQEKALIGSYSSDILLQDRAADLIFQRTVDVRSLTSHRFAIASITEAIDLASHPRDNSLKIMVTP